MESVNDSYYFSTLEGRRCPLPISGLLLTRVVGHDHTGKYSPSCIIPPCLFSITYASCLFLVLLPYMHIYYVYVVALRGSNTTPSFVD
jgi:hypothetical protein